MCIHIQKQLDITKVLSVGWKCDDFVHDLRTTTILCNLIV